MKVVIQRVKKSKVTVAGNVLGEIGPGYTILLGVKEGDSGKNATLLAEKIVNLRIVADAMGKMNKSILDTGGEILAISQFTLYADLSGGRRPSFTQAAKPEVSKPLYEFFVAELRRLGVKKVATGEFGADMLVEIENDGPVTIIIDTESFSR